MKKYNTILFDFDYTLVDSSQGITMCFQHVLNNNGYSTVSNDAIRRTIGKTLEESFAILTGVADADKLQGFKREYVSHANTCMTANTHFCPNTADTLKTLKNNGIKLGIISTKYRYRILEFTDAQLGKGFFDIIVGGEDVTTAKPSPEGVLFALNALKSTNDATLYIGDSTVDAQTAQNAKVHFAGLLNGTTTHSELAAYPNIAILNNISQLLELVLI